MAEEGGYEIMPYKEIVALKKQIDELKRRTGDTDSKQLLMSMSNLTKSMNNMLQLFKTAAEEMKLEQKEEEAISRKVEPLLGTVSELKEQNKIIAEGMVAIADMVKEMKAGKPHKPSFESHSLGPEPHKEHIMPPPIEPVRFVPSKKPKGPGPLPPLGGMPPPGGPHGPESFPPLGGPEHMPPPGPIPPPPRGPLGHHPGPHEPLPPLGGMPPGHHEPLPPLGGPGPMPPLGGPGPIPPPPGGPMPPGAGPLPPLDEPFPPLGKPKKKGFLGLFKKKK